MEKQNKNPGKAFTVAVCVLSAALFCYAQYSFYFVYIAWKNLALVGLYTVLTGAAFFAACYSAARSDTVKVRSKSKCLLSATIGLAVQQAVMWGTLWFVNIVLYHENGNVQAVTIACILMTIMLAVIYIVNFKHLWSSGNKPLYISLTALVLAGSLIFSAGYGARQFDITGVIRTMKNDRRNEPINQLSTSDFSFDTVSADDIRITKKEKEDCRLWYNKNILTDTESPAYDFKYGDSLFSQTMKDWKISIGETGKKGELYKGGETTQLTLTNDEKNLTARVEATLYPDYAACEWTVYIKNSGENKSPVISDFYAINASLQTGGSQSLYYSVGSPNSSEDFTLKKISDFSQELEFHATNGRPSDEYMPYFNVCGKDRGYILGIGWTGQWLASISENEALFNAKVGQEELKGYLQPGEEIRSPLISLSFYSGGNAMKGFNSFRRWVSKCVYPVGVNNFSMLEIAKPESKRTSDEIIDEVNKIDKSVLASTDYFWMDAGWYKYTDSWYDGVGSWIVDKSRYDNGISELSDMGKKQGIGLVLWYEPERVISGTALYDVASKHDGWTVNVKGSNNIWNFADDNACDYICKYIASSLNENGVSVYRQDFNFEPIEYWKKADNKYYNGRDGFCENHYVTNYYKYLDYLTENVDGLLMDNCASGGRRLDLEMTRRSIPLWRSDYNCEDHDDILEATQAQTYGISFWLPLSGTLDYCSKNTEYASRSSIMPCVINTFDSVKSKYYCDYSSLRSLQKEAYFPLTDGNTDNNKYLAMQYGSYDGSKGMALIYKRADVTDDSFTVKFNGLNAEKLYNVRDYDSPAEARLLTGSSLMNEGFKVTIDQAPEAVIIMYTEVQ